MYDAELSFAHDLADAAAEIALTVFGGSMEVRTKPDESPVTEADIRIEAMIRERVHARFPNDGVLGEEGGDETGGDGARRWIVDPIDGTKNFADGVQVWATLIALAVEDRPVLGLVSAPALGERYAAVLGQGATLNDAPIHVSRADRVGRAFVVFGGMGSWLDGPWAPGVQQLIRECRRSRGFGDFWGHVLVARGAADVMLEAELATWDFAATRIVVEEAGGLMTQLDGRPVEHGGSVLVTNGLLHDEIVARLKPED